MPRESPLWIQLRSRAAILAGTGPSRDAAATRPQRRLTPSRGLLGVICRSAQRAYHATRLLMQNGFRARTLSGGMLSRAMLAAG